MDKNVAFLLRAVSDKPEYRAVADYLMARRATPPVEERYLGENTNGKYEYNTFFGNDLPRQGKVTLNSRNGPSESVGTLIHELTHGAQRQLVQQYYDTKDRAGPQYKQGYEKLMLKDKTKEVAALLNPEFVKNAEAYRKSGNELQAFGMGNSSVESRGTYPVPPHIDATMATEFQILLDLAMRDQSTKPPKGR